LVLGSACRALGQEQPRFRISGSLFGDVVHSLAGLRRSALVCSLGGFWASVTLFLTHSDSCPMGSVSNETVVLW
jgi:hypothetical protein